METEKTTQFPAFKALNKGEIVPLKDLMEEDPTGGKFLFDLWNNNVINVHENAGLKAVLVPIVDFTKNPS